MKIVPKIKNILYSNDEIRFIEFEINKIGKILSYENFLAKYPQAKSEILKKFKDRNKRK